MFIIDKKTVVPREQHFPNSLSDSDSESDNIPLSDILASRSKGNFLCNPIVLESDEVMEMSETGKENVDSQAICSIESKSSKKEQEENRKKKHCPKLTSPFKEKSLSHKKSKGKNSSVSQKPNLSRISETIDHLLKNERSDSLTEKSNNKVSQSFAEEKEGRVLCNKKSMTEISHTCEKLKEKTNTNETNNLPLSNEVNFNSKQSSTSDEPVKPIIKRRVLPPRKTKKVPDPIASTAHSISFDSTLKLKELSSISKDSSGSKVNKTVSCPPELHSPTHKVCLDSILEYEEVPSICRNSSVSEVNKTIPCPPKLYFPAPVVSFDSTSKEMPSLSPINVDAVGKCSSSKPKTMAEFFTDDFPDCGSVLPINPDPISSSSYTADTFPASRNLLATDTCKTSPNKENNLVNKISPEREETEKIGQKRKLLLYSVKDSSGEESLIKSPPRTENILDNVSAIENAALHPSDVQLNQMHLSSDKEKLLKVATDTCKTFANKKNNLVNKISSEREETEKTGQKRKLSSSSVKDSSGEEGLIKSPPRTETIRDNVSATENAALLPSHVQLNEVYLSSSDKESLLKVATDTCKTSNKENNLVNKISPEREKISQKRKLSSSVKDSSGEEDLIKSSPRTEIVIENVSATENVALLTSQVQLNEVHLSSSAEKRFLKSPVNNLNCEQKNNETAAQPEKKQKLSAGFRPHHETFTNKVSDQMKSSETDKSISLCAKTTEKLQKEQKLPIRRSQLNKTRPKSTPKRTSIPSTIPAGVKMPTKWSNSKIIKYSSMIARSENELGSNVPRSRSTLKIADCKSPLKTNSSFQRKAENPLDLPRKPSPYKTLYTKRQACRLQLENRRSPFRQLPNVNNCRSSTHRHGNKSKMSTTPNFICSESELSFSKERAVKDYSRTKQEHKAVFSKTNKSNCRESESQKHIFPFESSNRNISKHESPISSFGVSEKHLDNQDSSNKHTDKGAITLPEKFNTVIEDNELSSKNVEASGNPKRNIATLNENFHEQAARNFSADEERKFIVHNNKNIFSKEKLISVNKIHKSSDNLIAENILSSVPEKSDSLFEKDRMNLTVVPKLASGLSYDKDTKLSISELGKESQIQLQNPFQFLGVEQNKEVQEEQLGLNCDKIFDEVVVTTSRTSGDQNELDQAVAFLTNDEITDSQEPVISSQNIVDGSKVADETSDKNSKDFSTLVIEQLSKAAGFSVPLQVQDISHLVEKIQEFGGFDNIKDLFRSKE